MNQKQIRRAIVTLLYQEDYNNIESQLCTLLSMLDKEIEFDLKILKEVE